jgi:hypothetical protein
MQSERYVSNNPKDLFIDILGRRLNLILQKVLILQVFLLR